MSPVKRTDMRILMLQEFYGFLTAQPHDGWRASHQSLYAHTRDALAELTGRDPQALQDEFEAAVAANAP